MNREQAPAEGTPKPIAPDDNRLVSVEADHMEELAHRYAAYRQALSVPADPLRVLRLAGDVLETVRRITGPLTVRDAGPCQGEC